jgi:hypothetical protein
LQNHGRSSEEIREHVRRFCAVAGAQIPISITPFFFPFPFLYCFLLLCDDDRFTLTPPRMRMIVDAFKDTLELGLEKPKQVVVRFPLLGLWVPKPRSERVETFPPMRPLRAPLFYPFAGCMTKRVAPCDGPGWAWALPAHAKEAQLPIPAMAFARDVDGCNVNSQ